MTKEGYLEGADQLLSSVVVNAVLVDKGYDADERVLETLQAHGKTAVVPPRSKRKQQREYDQALGKAHYLIENFFCQA